MQKSSSRVKIAMTGGHAGTTAAAVVEEIKLQRKDWDLYWIGAERAIEGKNVRTLEAEILPEMGVTFLPLTTGRLQTRFTRHTIPSLFKIPTGLIQAFYYLLRLKPKIVVSFGGFASFPVVLIAKLLGIPVVLHEQTSAAGRASIVSGKLADKITLARKESTKYFPKEKCIVIGNPILREIFLVKPFGRLGPEPALYITGGSRGSQRINEVFGDLLPEILTRYKVMHQTGQLDFDKFKEIQKSLPEKLRPNYKVFARISPSKLKDIYDEADIVVARAGANTVSEVVAARRSAILIPLPISFLDEQTRNAEFAEKWGIARIIPQDELNKETLLDGIESIRENYLEIINRVKSKESPDKGAAKKLVGIVSSFLK